MFPSRIAVIAMTLLPIASPAGAAEISPDGAATLERQLRGWMVDMVGPSVPVPERPVQVTPAGDHYAVTVPTGLNTLQITASARPLDGGKWAVDDVRVTSPAEFTVNVPATTGADGKANPLAGPVTYRLSIAQQAGQALFDSTFQTPSTVNSSTSGLRLEGSGEHIQQLTQADHGTNSVIVRPTENGRLDVLSDGTVEGYSMDTKAGDAERLKIAIGRIQVTGQITSLSRDRGAQIVRALAQLGAAQAEAAKTGVAPMPVPKLDPKTAQALLEAVADVATGFNVNESFEKLSVTYGDFGGSLNAAKIGVTAKSQAGLLQASMELGLEGPQLPDILPENTGALVPTKVSVRPAVSGLSVADLLRLAQDSQGGQPPPDADVAALFSHGGISAGLDEFSIDVAGANFTGLGKVVFTGPQTFSGTAQITATNLDLLQQQVASVPSLAAALPAFIFAKGIGRTVGNQVVWDVNYRDGRLQINNQDMSSLMGSGGQKGGTPRTAPRPNRSGPPRP